MQKNVNVVVVGSHLSDILSCCCLTLCGDSGCYEYDAVTSQEILVQIRRKQGHQRRENLHAFLQVALNLQRIIGHCHSPRPNRQYRHPLCLEPFWAYD